MTIKNPVEWSGQQLVHAARAIGTFGHSLQHIAETVHSPAPVVRRIGTADLRDALRKGFDDFKVYRSDVVCIGIIYVIIGLVLGQALLHASLVPMLFPLASGFAIIGPFAAVGLYEMSRRREQGAKVTWTVGLEMLHEPGFGAIVVLGLALVVIFALWLAAAWAIFQLTLGPALPPSVEAFTRDVIATHAGHVMIIAGVGVGFLFAAFAMMIGVISFPLLLDRDVGLDTAVRTSIRAVIANPGPLALWGAIVVGALLLGCLPMFVGLAVVIPVLGHATWHLYRKVVTP